VLWYSGVALSSHIVSLKDIRATKVEPLTH
jgi:hypothetical protein